MDGYTLMIKNLGKYNTAALNSISIHKTKTDHIPIDVRYKKKKRNIKLCIQQIIRNGKADI